MQRPRAQPAPDVISDVTVVEPRRRLPSTARQAVAADLAAAAAAVASYRFTVGPDEAFPQPPSPLVRPKNSSSDSSGDSGISMHQLAPSSSLSSTPPASQCHLSNGPLSVTSRNGSLHQPQQHGRTRHTCDWSTGTLESTTAVNRRQSAAARMNGGVDGASNSWRSSTASSSSSSSSGSSGFAGSVGHIAGHQTQSQFCNSNHNNYSPAGVGVAGSQGHLNHALSSSGHVYGYHGDSRSSLDRLQAEGCPATVDVADLLRQGYADADVLYAWLASMRLDHLCELFLQAGYDMATISRMTPEDLTAIGITQPGVRKRLTSEISKLCIGDRIPQLVPMSVQEWLSMLCLDVYVDNLLREGFISVEQITDITWEDLEDIGIHKLGHQKKLMLAVDRLRKCVSSSFGLARQPTTTSTPMQPIVPAVEPRTSSLVRKLSSSRSSTVDGPGTPGRHGQPASATATATEIIHIRDDPVVVQPEVVAIHVSRSSSTWATAASAADDDDDIVGGVSSSLTYESFRGPSSTPQSPPLAAVDVVPDRRDRLGVGDDGERTPTNEVDQVSSQHHNRGDVVMMSAAPSSVTASQVPSVASASSSAKVAVTSSQTSQTSSSRVRAPTSQAPAPASQVPSVMSPSSPRQRPQIAPKPRLDLRRRRASAGDSTTTTVGDDNHGVDVASPTSKTGNNDVASPTSPLSTTPGLAMLASVMAAASSHRMSERCRSPQSPSPIQRPAADITPVDKKTVGNCARPSSASALSRTALNGSGSNLGSASSSQTLRAHSRTGTSSSTSLGTDKKTHGTDHQAESPARTTSTGNSPRHGSTSTVPPPVPPKHTHSFKVEKRSADTSVPPRIDACSSSSVSSAAVQGLGAGSASSPADTGTLPFANENVGTIRQRVTVVPVEQPTGSAASVTATTDVPKKPQRPVPKKKPKLIMQDGKVTPVTEQRVVTDTVTSPTPSTDLDDVFNDIDNMFQGLAQELDEMLTLQDV